MYVSSSFFVVKPRSRVLIRTPITYHSLIESLRKKQYHSIRQLCTIGKERAKSERDQGWQNRVSESRREREVDLKLEVRYVRYYISNKYIIHNIMYYEPTYKYDTLLST